MIVLYRRKNANEGHGDWRGAGEKRYQMIVPLKGRADGPLPSWIKKACAMENRMPRTQQHGLDFGPWDVGMFDGDWKIEKLIEAHGWKGFGIYFYLCQMAYGTEGYFYCWGFDGCPSTARKMGGGVGLATVEETVRLCLRVGLFDQGLFDKWSVLTSAGIQRRYRNAIRERRVKTVYKELWLLEPEESEGLVKVALPQNFTSKHANPRQILENQNFEVHKLSKVKKSNSSCPDSADAARDEASDQKQKAKKDYPHDSMAYRAAEWLGRMLMERYPERKAIGEDRLQKWAVEIDRLNRLDGYDWKLISDVAAWSQQDAFWQTNILSANALRRNFDKLLAKMKSEM